MYNNLSTVDIGVLIGKVITDIQGAETGNDEIFFSCSDGSRYRMYHEQDCCEDVSIEDICGDISCLLGTPVLMAEESTNSDCLPRNDYDESFTWTFYKFATVKGYVTIRWYGESNGYYSESVEFAKIINDGIRCDDVFDEVGEHKNINMDACLANSDISKEMEWLKQGGFLKREP